MLGPTTLFKHTFLLQGPAEVASNRVASLLVPLWEVSSGAEAGVGWLAQAEGTQKALGTWANLLASCCSKLGAP